MKGYILVYLALLALGISCVQPKAPVGNYELTVPSTVRPLFDYWVRDTYVMNGPDGYYYMTGTIATPERYFPAGRIHCWDYNDGWSTISGNN